MAVSLGAVGSGGTAAIGNTSSGSCTGTQSVVTATNSMMVVALAVNTGGNWLTSFSTLTVTSSVGGTFNDVSDVFMGTSGQSTQSIHLFLCQNPPSGSHTLTANCTAAGGVWIGGNITIASALYTGTTGYRNLVTQGNTVASTAALNLAVNSISGDMAVVVAADGSSTYGTTLNQTLRSNISSAAPTQYVQLADALGAPSVSFTTTANSTTVGAIGLDLIAAPPPLNLYNIAPQVRASSW